MQRMRLKNRFYRKWSQGDTVIEDLFCRPRPITVSSRIRQTLILFKRIDYGVYRPRYITMYSGLLNHANSEL